MGRKRGRRFRKGKDTEKQLEEIENAQQAARQGKRIDSITKSKQLRNAFKQIKDSEDAKREFDE